MMVYMNEIRKDYQDLINQWSWELHITFHFANYVDFGTATKQVKQWIKFHRSTFKGIKFAGLILLSNGHHDTPHAHVLLTSDQNYPRTLSDINPITLKLLERHWDIGSCKITTCRDWSNETISKYLAKEKNISLYNPDNWDLEYYRPNVLKGLKKVNDIIRFVAI